MYWDKESRTAVNKLIRAVVTRYCNLDTESADSALGIFKGKVMRSMYDPVCEKEECIQGQLHKLDALYIIILPVVLYDCETWSLPLREEDY